MVVFTVILCANCGILRAFTYTQTHVNRYGYFCKLIYAKPVRSICGYVLVHISLTDASVNIRRYVQRRAQTSAHSHWYFNETGTVCS